MGRWHPPACAGQTFREPPTSVATAAHPRVRGANPFPPCASSMVSVRLPHVEQHARAAWISSFLMDGALHIQVGRGAARIGDPTVSSRTPTSACAGRRRGQSSLLERPGTSPMCAGTSAFVLLERPAPAYAPEKMITIAIPRWLPIATIVRGRRKSEEDVRPAWAATRMGTPRAYMSGLSCRRHDESSIPSISD